MKQQDKNDYILLMWFPAYRSFGKLGLPIQATGFL